MSRVTQNHSQLLFTYGPGAMLDLPEHAAIVAGLEDWDAYAGQAISEPRLTELLKGLNDERAAHAPNPSLRTPPFDDEDRHGDNAPGIAVRVFPGWFVCERAIAQGNRPEDSLQRNGSGETRRRMVRFSDVQVGRGNALTYNLDGTKVRVNPIRFVAACSKGHLQDLDWRRLVHQGHEGTCNRPMSWVERGVSSDPADIAVRCDCGARVTLSELYQPERLGSCGGSSPWLTPRHHPDDPQCEEALRLLPRAATNAYFPQTLTIISLPEADDALARAVERHWDTISGFLTVDSMVDMLRRIPGIREDLREHSDVDVQTAIEQRGQTAGSGAADPRIEEFDRFTADVDTVGRDGAGSRLFAQRLDLSSLEIPARVGPLVDGIVRVHRLREVACIYGFTRLEPAPTALESELDDITLATEGAPLSRSSDWYPATEQFGEGIFVRLNSQTIADWQTRDAVRERIDQLRVGERLDARRRSRDPEHLGPAYWALHTLSHAFMAELALDCGYPLASLKERIYASKTGENPRHGLLIYTATSGGQGTLGGLSHMASRTPMLLERAFERMNLCSNDPVCSEHRPDDRHDDRHLHGAACHACLLVPETSCEARNGRLDRSFFLDGHAASLL